MSSALFFFLKISLTNCGLLCFNTDLEIVSSISLKIALEF